MNNSWQTKKLGEVCEMKPPKSEARTRLKGEELVSFVPMEDLGILVKTFIPQQERKLKDVAGSYTYFADNDVLLAKITPCFENGKIGIARNLKNGIGFGSSEYFVFRANGILSSEFLYYFLSREDFREKGASLMTGAVGHKRVPKEFVENLEIPLPPLHEQQRIVKILDEVFTKAAKAKENAEKNLANAGELFQSYLQSVFANPAKGWGRERIEVLCESIMDCVNKTAPKIDYPTPYKMIRTTNVKAGKVNIESVFYVNEETFKKWTRREEPKRGDVILTREAPMGEVGMLLTDDHIFLGQRLVSYRTNPKILNNYFLLYAFLSNDLQGQIKSLASGSTVQHMRVPDSKALKVSVPPLAEQHSIVAKLDALSAETKKLEAIYKQKLSALEELKKTVLAKAFRGEL
jgi:type I restriction enzyme S subunit